MAFLIRQRPTVKAVRVLVSRAVGSERQGTTVEMQAEAVVSDPARWREEVTDRVEELIEMIGAGLEHQKAAPPVHARCRISGRPNGSSGAGERPTDRYWLAVYSAGKTQEDGLALLEEVQGDFAQGLQLARNRWNGAASAD